MPSAPSTACRGGNGMISKGRFPGSWRDPRVRSGSMARTIGYSAWCALLRKNVERASRKACQTNYRSTCWMGDAFCARSRSHRRSHTRNALRLISSLRRCASPWDCRQWSLASCRSDTKDSIHGRCVREIKRHTRTGPDSFPPRRWKNAAARGLAERRLE